MNAKRVLGELNIVHKEKDVLSMEFIGLEPKHDIDYKKTMVKMFQV